MKTKKDQIRDAIDAIPKHYAPSYLYVPDMETYFAVADEYGFFVYESESLEEDICLTVAIIPSIKNGMFYIQ